MCLSHRQLFRVKHAKNNGAKPGHICEAQMKFVYVECAVLACALHHHICQITLVLKKTSALKLPKK